MIKEPHVVERSNPERISSEVDQNNLPKHIAVVMDGNGRWAQKRGLSRTKGHEQGEQALYDVVYGALDLGIKWITVYAFSTENWKRPAKEVSFLMNFNEKLLLARKDELDKHNVRIRFIGKRESKIPSRLLKRMNEAQEQTKDNDGINFTIAFNYGGRTEIVDAFKSMLEQNPQLDAKQIDEKIVAQNLYCPQMPEVDLVFRSSGEQRTSNFMLWQSAYAELVFTNTLWPDVRREDLFQAVIEFQNRNRRFGAI